MKQMKHRVRECYKALTWRKFGYILWFLLIPCTLAWMVGANAGSSVEGLAAGSGALALTLLLHADLVQRQKLYTMRYLPLGAFFGAGLGVFVSLVAGNLTFVGVGVGLGTATGVAAEQFRR